MTLYQLGAQGSVSSMRFVHPQLAYNLAEILKFQYNTNTFFHYVSLTQALIFNFNISGLYI